MYIERERVHTYVHAHTYTYIYISRGSHFFLFPDRLLNTHGYDNQCLHTENIKQKHTHRTPTLKRIRTMSNT